MDRRSFLATIPVVAVAAAVPATALAHQASPTGDWEVALRNWREAQAEYVKHPYGSALPDHPEYRRYEEEAEALSDRESHALDAVMETRAPNRAALIEKLKIIEREYGDDFYIRELIADVRALPV
jgi:hypothetical protein